MANRKPLVYDPDEQVLDKAAVLECMALSHSWASDLIAVAKTIRMQRGETRKQVNARYRRITTLLKKGDV